MEAVEQRQPPLQGQDEGVAAGAERHPDIVSHLLDLLLFTPAPQLIPADAEQES